MVGTKETVRRMIGPDTPTFVCIDCRHVYVRHVGEHVLFPDTVTPGIVCRRCARASGELLAGVDDRLRANWHRQRERAITKAAADRS